MFRVGQEIECVADFKLDNIPWQDIQDLCGQAKRLPQKGERFIVRWCGTRPTDYGICGVMLNEIIMPYYRNVEITFDHRYFRAIVKTDISALVKLCNPIPMKVLEPI